MRDGVDTLSEFSIDAPELFDLMCEFALPREFLVRHFQFTPCFYTAEGYC